AVLKQTSPTAAPSAPKPWPSITVPSARTSSPVTRGASHSENRGARADGLAAPALAGRAPVLVFAIGILSSFSPGCLMYAFPVRQGCAASPLGLSDPPTRPGIFAMGLRGQINENLKAAMKAGDKRQVST